MPNIHITNASNNYQEFEVHGWNNNQTITVGSHQTSTIGAPDGQQSSGAIIALHDGHEGEQAEITFNGWGGNEYFDISAIVGAGGNLTIEQVGNPGSRKGDESFMQDLRKAWNNADDNTKKGLHDCVHLDGNGQVTRIDAPKEHQALERFVRTFAEGRLYIGVGAWGNARGDSGDNAQSSGVHGGNKDVQIIYSDAETDAGFHRSMVMQNASAARKVPAVLNGQTIVHATKAPVKNIASTVSRNGVGKAAMKVPAKPVENGIPPTHAQVKTPVKGPVEPSITSSSLQGPSLNHVPLRFPVRNLAASSPFGGDPDDGSSPGINLTNKSRSICMYFFFDNYWNGNGTAGANFDHPSRSISLQPNTSAFVSLPETFKGRVQRGKFIPATWVEFQLSAENGTGAWGDVSLEQGYDGPAIIKSENGQNGFSNDIMNGAPDAACATRAQDGVRVLASTMGNWLGGPNRAAIDWENQKVGQRKAYIQGGSGTNVVNSQKKRLAIDMY